MVTGTTFNPASLFALYGASGIYIPNFNFSLLTASGLSPLYLESIGTVPVTATTQVNGLALDQSQGAAIGSEIITNPGPFTTTTGYTGVSATLSVNAGDLVITADDGSGDRAEWSLSGLTVGAYYLVTVEASATGASARLTSWTWASELPSTAITASMTVYSFRLRATATSGVARFYSALSGVAGDVLRLRQFSVKRISGNHAYQATSAARGTIQLVGSRYVWRGDGVDDNLLTTLVPATSMTMMVACEFNAAADAVIGCYGSGSNRCYITTTAGGFLGGAVAAQSESTIKGASDIRDIPGVAVLRFDGATVSLFWKPLSGAISKIYDAAQSGANTSVPAIRVGAINQAGIAGTFLDGDIYSVFAIQAALTDAEIAQVADYFSR